MNRELLQSLLVEKLTWPEYQELERNLMMLASDGEQKKRIDRTMELIAKAMLKQSAEL